MFVFDGSTPSEVPCVINLKAGSFTLVLVPPTAEERIVDDGMGFEVMKSHGEAHTEAYRRRFLRRLGRVKTWTGINDPNGTPLEFNLQNLHRVLNKFPVALDPLNVALNAIYSIDEVAEGKPDGQPGDASTGSPSSVASSTTTPSAFGSQASADASA